jgi:hypothetical protein
MDYVAFTAALRNRLLTVTAHTEAIVDRLYFTGLGTLPPQPYPAASIQLAEGKSFLDIVRDFPMTVSAYSDMHFDEASAILDTLSGVLDGLIIPGAVVFRVTSQPTQNYLTEPNFYSVSIAVHAWLL